jgi:hypothetical protein
MDQSNLIWRSFEGDGRNTRNTLQNLLGCCTKAMSGLLQSASYFTGAVHRRVNNMSDLAWEQGTMKNTCLGDALALIASKQCQYFGDRFIALNVMLNCQRILGATGMPTSNIDACISVFAGAMQRGDLSPLLLQPRERVLNSDPDPGTPSWLVGCHDFDAAEWDLERELGSRIPPASLNGRVVEVDLNFAGVIEEIQYLNMEKSGSLAGIDWTIQLLLRMADSDGTVLSPKRLVDGLHRIFPTIHPHSQVAGNQNIVYSFADLQQRDMQFAQRIEKQLAKYVSAAEGGPGARQREAAVSEVARMLNFWRKYPTLENQPVSGYFTRFAGSTMIAAGRTARGVTGGEPICRVRCATCYVCSLLRLDLRRTASVGAKVFWIPGLTYSGSTTDGVGLVLQDRRIVGRMIYGTICCGCRLAQRVKIE